MRIKIFVSVSLLALCTAAVAAQKDGRVALWLTTADRQQLLSRQTLGLQLTKADSEPKTIVVDSHTTYQPVDGFGFAMTGGSAQLIHRMSPAKRHELLKELFGKDGISYLRLSIGSSDMNDHVYTYDDMPAGQVDATLKHFTLDQDAVDLIPVMKEVMALSPAIQILASPWSAPSWMKSNDASKGGKLQPAFYKAYANYLVRYITEMQAQGIPITALTMQNEPLNPKNTPSMVMEAAEEGAFLRDALGPALQAAGLHTRVVLFDHNCNHPDYPITILSDPKAAAYADGSGFHLYEGDISALSKVHDAFPKQNLYFTEQMVIEEKRGGVQRPIAEPVSRIVIGAMRNWSRNVLLWNLAADPDFGPHTSDGGCPVCQGAITINGDDVSRNIAFYTIVHASRFVPPGSTRIQSTETTEGLSNVAWLTREGEHVLLVTNTASTKRDFTVGSGDLQFSSTLDAGSTGTFIW